MQGALCSVVRYSKVTEPKPAPLEFRQQLRLALVQCTGHNRISDKMSVGGKWNKVDSVFGTSTTMH